jgi:REP element-mobilizing transposase RayT
VFFITVCCRERGGNHLCLPPVAAAVFESVSFRIQRGDWFVHLLLLMPDHLHALISFPRDQEIKTVVAQWKEILAKRARIPWQRDFFDHRLRTQESYDEKASYIRMNPVRKGLVPAPEQWPWAWEPEAGQRTIVAPAR